MWRLEIVDELGSTSDAVIARAEAGEASGLALLARRQTAGRGSRGRDWIEPARGNLAVSVLLRPERSSVTPGGIVFLAAVALADALARYVPAPWALELKWPNDVLLVDANGARGKLAGILVETGSPTDTAPGWIVIGFGANLRHAPAIADARALPACGAAAPAPEAVARDLCERLGAWWQIAERDGFAAIRAAWLARAHPVGTPLRSVAGDHVHAGRFAGIEADGVLVLAADDGDTHRVSTGLVLLEGGR